MTTFRRTSPRHRRAKAAAAAHHTHLHLEEFLPYRMVDLASRMSRALGAAYGARFDLTIPEWRVVAVLGRFGPLPAGAIAERTSMDKPKVTRALKRLESAGRVTRTADVRDRRSVEIALTPLGLVLFGEVARLALAWEQELLAGLTSAERADLATTLDRLTERLADPPLLKP
jgi:DNA-binding MarR family transcriptional regulator